VDLSALRAELRELKEAGQQSVSIDALLTITDGPAEPAQGHEQAMAVWHESNARYRLFYDAKSRAELEVLRTVIEFGKAALQSAILINGGAAVAILAYLGKSADAQHSVARGLLAFVFGVLGAAVGTGVAYVSQCQYLSGKQCAGRCLRAIAMILVGVSYVLFGLGAWLSYAGL
jgi:hypothetical protein